MNVSKLYGNGSESGGGNSDSSLPVQNMSAPLPGDIVSTPSTTYWSRFSERIVVSGSEYSQNRYKYNFIEPAIKLLKASGGTWIISQTGYSQSDISKFTKVAKNLGVKLVLINSAQELYNYINSMSISNRWLSDIRKSCQISSFTVFSHGLVGKVSLGYNQGNKTASLEMTTDGISKNVIGEAFSAYQYSTFYSCNTGTMRFPALSFAQVWANIVGGTTKAAVNGTTWYGDINKGEGLLAKADWKFNGFRQNGCKNYPVPSSDVQWGYFYR